MANYLVQIYKKIQEDAALRTGDTPVCRKSSTQTQVSHIHSVPRQDGQFWAQIRPDRQEIGRIWDFFKDQFLS